MSRATQHRIESRFQRWNLVKAGSCPLIPAFRREGGFSRKISQRDLRTRSCGFRMT
jgi:hypothetical protein